MTLLRKTDDTEEERAIKRANGEIACSECSRLKLKCDRKLPACSSCVRRNCEHICPHGTLPPTKTKRPDKKVSAEQYDDIAAQIARIQLLEDALTVLHSLTSPDQEHPLLTDELLKVKLVKLPDSSKSGTSAELTDIAGTLSLGPRGDTKYFGPLGGPEGILYLGTEELGEDEDRPRHCDFHDPSDISLSGPETAIQQLLTILPSNTRAWELSEKYLQFSWLWEGAVDSDELEHDLLTPLYARGEPANLESISLTAHQLAVIFLVLALGSSMDVAKELDSDEADWYFQAGKAALSLNGIEDSPELATVQALHLLAAYHLRQTRRCDMDIAISLTSLAVKRGESIGLHRESPDKTFDTKILNRRRRVWWEVLGFDTVLNTNLGRPPTAHPSYADCRFPDDDNACMNDAGIAQPGLNRLRFMFIKEIYLPGAEEFLGSKASTYSSLLEFEKKLVEFSPLLSYPVELDAEDQLPAHEYIRRHFPMETRLSLILMIHMAYFTRVIIQNTSNPLDSPHSRSFQASHDAAVALVTRYAKQMQCWPEVIMRMWTFWTRLTSAAMVLGSIAAYCPNCPIAADAYMHLSTVITIFETGAARFAKAQSGLVMTRKLMTIATAAFSNGHASAQPDFRILEVFGGKTTQVTTA